jgi:hypothetical protein
MATGKNALDIFKPTAGKKADRAIELTKRMQSHPVATDADQKVELLLPDRQIQSLDKIAVKIKERTGQTVHRDELIRAILDRAAGSLNPKAHDFDKKVRKLFPNLDKHK